MVRAFVFDMSIPCDKTSVKVKYQGHNFQINGHCGGIHVARTHLVSLASVKGNALGISNATPFKHSPAIYNQGFIFRKM